jgi:hypothetical protein
MGYTYLLMHQRDCAVFLQAQESSKVAIEQQLAAIEQQLSSTGHLVSGYGPWCSCAN